MTTTNAATGPHATTIPPLAGSRHLTERSRRDDIASVRTALRCEWIKVSSLRSNRWILALTPVIGVLLSWILATFVKTDPDTGLAFNIGETFIFSTWLTTVLATIVGTLMFTSEVQHGTIATAVAAQPARWVTVAAKSVIAAGFGLAMGILGMIGGLSGAVLGGLEKGDTSGMAATALWGLLLATLAPLLGLGIGMILRHSAAAVSILLVWAFVLENLLRAHPGDGQPAHAVQCCERPARHHDGNRYTRDDRRSAHPSPGRHALRRLRRRRARRRNRAALPT